jgi:diacylglycerol kinase family enzyme
MKYHFFYNPYSRGFDFKILKSIAKKFGNESIHTTMIDYDKMKDKFKKIIDSDSVVIGLGGDGTLRLLINSFLGLTDKFAISLF